MADAALGAGGVTGELTAVGEHALGPVEVAANLGAGFGPTRAIEGGTVGDALVARAGAAWSPVPSRDAGLALEVGGRLGGGGAWGEWLASGWAGVGADVALRAGLGTGLTRGIGAPALRAVVGVSAAGLGARRQAPEAVMAGPGDRDTDSDGISDLHDACDDAPEDIDDVGDADGCPEPEVPLEVVVVGPDGVPPPVVRWDVGGARVVGDRAALVPGAWEIAVDAPGYAPARLPVALGADGLRVTVTLERTSSRIVVDRTRITLAEPLAVGDGGTIAPEGSATLDEVAAVLLRHPALDRVRIRAAPAVARAVVAHLVARGVPEPRLTVEPGDQAEPELLVDRWAP